MKNLSESEINLIKKDLFASKSVKRRSAAKKINKYKLNFLKDDLLTSYLEETKDSRTWETQTEMIKAIGNIGCKEAIPYLKEIIIQNKDMDTITIFATLSYIRLTRENINDLTSVMYFLRNGSKSVFNGAIKALAFDDIVPSENEMKEIIMILEERSVYLDPYTYPTQQIISLMYRWPNEIIIEFLNHYINHPQYMHFIENTLNGKKSCKE